LQILELNNYIKTKTRRASATKSSSQKEKQNQAKQNEYSQIFLIFRRSGELLIKQRSAAEISFKSSKFMVKERWLRFIQGVGSFFGKTPAAKY